MPRARASHRRSLLISDLDGTLLRPDATLGETTIRVLNGYIADGGMFTYATARSFATAARLTAPLNLRLPVITYGGAIIVDPLTGAARQARVLPADLVEAVFRLTHGSPVAPPTRLGPRDRLAPATGQAVDLASSFP